MEDTLEGNGPACNPYEGMTQAEKDAYIERSAPNDTENAEAIAKSPSGPIIVDPHFMPRDSKGHFLKGYAPNTGIMRGDSQRAGELNARRQELAASKARAALVEAYTEHTGKPGGRPSDAYGELAGEFARSALANAMNKPREGVEAGKFALRLAKMLPEADKAANVAVAVQIVLAPEAASFIEGVWTATSGGEEVGDG